MKKLLVMIIPLILLVLVGPEVFAVDRKAFDETIELKERLLELGHGKSASQLTDLKEMQSRLEKSLTQKESVSPQGEVSPNYWFSSNPEDLEPLLGTTWYFEYVILITFDRTITFGNAVETTDDGYVYLTCTDEYGYEGIVMFVYDIPDNEYISGNAFTLVLERSTLYSFFTFQISGNSATGFYAHQTKDDGEYSDNYPLTGTKIGDDTISTLSGWIYLQWPYAYSAEERAWFYLFPEGQYLWYLNLSTNQWNKLPE